MNEFSQSLQAIAQPALDRYRLLANAERWILLILVWLVLLVLFVSLVCMPVLQWRDQKKQAYENNQDLIAWMKAQAPALGQARNRAPSKRRGNQSLVSMIVQIAQTSKIPLQRYEPKGKEEVRVWLHEVQFDQLISWLNRLKHQYDITVSNIVIDQKPSLGMVKATIVLSG